VEAQPNVGFIGLGVMGHVRRLLTTAPSVWVRKVGSCGKVVFMAEAAEAVATLDTGRKASDGEPAYLCLGWCEL
jgi:hypothetical protein